ncbi:uncharacterized protein [Euwallacea fornicatus]|uniref:uncharacterized protein isoform X1 n=1 Tax=Euwallacea fornicatus TaxID=995702 RepID=UPI00338E31F8
MIKIQSSLLALVLGIFLIQAADPPYEKTTSSFLEFSPTSTPRVETVTLNNAESIKHLQSLYTTLQNIRRENVQKNESTKRIYSGLDGFLQKPDKTPDEKILEHNFVRPLLIQYQNIIHKEPPYKEADQSGRISKEDYVENFKILSKDEINLLLHSGEKYQHNQDIQGDNTNNGIANGYGLSWPQSEYSIQDVDSSYEDEAIASSEEYEVDGFRKEKGVEVAHFKFEDSLHNAGRLKLPSINGVNAQVKENTAKENLDHPLVALKKNRGDSAAPSSTEELNPPPSEGQNYGTIRQLLAKAEERDLIKKIENYMSSNTDIQVKDTRNNHSSEDSSKHTYEGPEPSIGIDVLPLESNGAHQIIEDRMRSLHGIRSKSPFGGHYKSDDNNDASLTRRDDSSVESEDNEHIGEILPPDFKFEESKVAKDLTTSVANPAPKYLVRKSYAYDDGFYPFLPQDSSRTLVTFPVERFRPDYEPSGASEEGYDSSSFSSKNRARFNELSTYRYPRRLRGLLGPFEAASSVGYQAVRGEQPRESYFDPSARFQTVWAGSSRRPRVIFPSDLVQFRDPVNSGSAPAEEPDWLAGDNNLQDLEGVDNRDRAGNTICVQGATCEFFLTCWISGGFIDNQCEGLLKACCYRGVAKAGLITQGPAIGTIEAPPEGPRSRDVTMVDDVRCGISSTKQQAQRRIVGGDEAGFGTFPWQAYIRIGSSRCGGSLISRRHVVTAGHCVARAAPRQVHVTLGDYVINSAVEPLPAYTFGVSSIQVHPFFKFTPQADRFDVAVLRLDRAAHNLPHVTPICLPAKGENFLGDVGHAAGWGALSPGSRLRPQTLQTVKVPVIDNRQCERWHRSKGIQVTIYDEMLCAGYKNGGRDSCQGDSGGPLMLQKTGRWYLIGIVSAGYSCAQPGQPGIYHRVANTVDWITRAVASR